MTAPPTVDTGDPTCPYCGGRGWVYYAEKYRYSKGEQIILESHLIPADMPPMKMRQAYPDHYYPTGDCECLQPRLAQARMMRVLGESGMPDDCYRLNMSDFENQPWFEDALAFSRRFVGEDSLVDRDGDVRTGLLLGGTPGVGKTTLGSLVFRFRVEAGQYSAAWKKISDLAELIKQTYNKGYDGPTKLDIRDTLKFASFLLLDDLGSLTQEGPYWEDFIQFLFQILDHRWSKRLPTLITTNLKAVDLEKQVGPAVMSRIHGLCHGIWISGPDHRRKA